GERAREYPVSHPTAVLDDSVFSPFLFAAWRAPAVARPVDVTAVVPRADRRETIRVEDMGPTATTLRGAPASLRLIRLSGGANQVVVVWLDRNRLIQKVEIPSRHLR